MPGAEIDRHRRMARPDDRRIAPPAHAASARLSMANGRKVRRRYGVARLFARRMRELEVRGWDKGQFTLPIEQRQRSRPLRYWAMSVSSSVSDALNRPVSNFVLATAS